MAPQRSITGNHDLLPSNLRDASIPIPHVDLHERSIAKITGGVVIWRIWPAVLLHTAFAAVIVVLAKKNIVHLEIPNVLLTLLGVVIGFVISLRVSSGYDRYWWGRCAWSDLVKTSRTMSRLIWIHTPPRIVKADGDTPPTKQEIGQAMREKRVAIELIEAFSVSLKHYLRGELGIYYRDLYHVVRPFHEHHEHHAQAESEPRRPRRQFSIESYSQLPADKRPSLRKSASKASSRENSNTSETALSGTAITSSAGPSTSLHPSSHNIIPAINSYGAVSTEHILRHASSRTSLASSNSAEDERDPLLPAQLPGPASGARGDLVPFASWLYKIGRAINPYYWYRGWRAHWREGFENSDTAGGVNNHWANDSNAAEQGRAGGVFKHWRKRAARQTHTEAGKHRPRVAGDGENLPLEILRCLSEWLSILEARGTVGGNPLGGMYGCVSQFEDSLATLERILTTPLPYVYSSHIRHTVWLYLFFLPFQLARDFNWYTIPGTFVAAFFYLGFIAAGDEIEQPFGYDENDLDLDLFCRDIIAADLHTLIMTPFPNAPHGSHSLENDINEASTVVEVSLANHGHGHGPK